MPWETVNQPSWSVAPTPDDYMQYASAEIMHSNAQLDAAKKPRLTIGATQAIINKWRGLSGLKPYENAYEVFLRARRERTQDSGWQNFKANVASTFAQQAGGITGVAYRTTDALGITKNQLKDYTRQLDEAQRIWAPAGGVSGAAGELVGTTMFALMFGMGGPKAPTGFTGRLKAAAPIAGAFGVSAAGSTFSQIARERVEGREIPAWKEWTAAFGNAAVEATTELFGWAAARGIASQIIRHTPGLGRIVARQGIQGGLAYLRRIASPVLKEISGGVAAGFTEEALSEIGQSTINKMLDITPHVKWGGDWFRAGMMGAAQALGMGGIMAGAQTIQTQQYQSEFRSTLTNLPDANLAYHADLLETAREQGLSVPEWAISTVQDEISKRQMTASAGVEAIASQTADDIANKAEDVGKRPPLNKTIRFPDMVRLPAETAPPIETLSFEASLAAEAERARATGRLLTFPAAFREQMPEGEPGPVIPIPETERPAPLPVPTGPLPEGARPYDVAQRLYRRGLEVTAGTPTQIEAAKQQLEQEELGRILQSFPATVSPSQKIAQVERAQQILGQARMVVNAESRRAAAAPGLEARPTVPFPSAAMAPAPTEAAPATIVPFEQPTEAAPPPEKGQAPPVLPTIRLYEETRQAVEAPEQSTRTTNATHLYPPSPLSDVARKLWTDEEGALDVQALGDVVRGGIDEVSGEVGTLTRGISALIFDESRPLRLGSGAGSFAHSVIQQAGNRGREMAGPFQQAWVDALESIPFKERGGAIRWMQQRREDGQTNWATLVEHPDRLAKNVPPAVQRLVEIYRSAFQDFIGEAAEQLRLPQLQQVTGPRGGESHQLRPFKRAKGLRYFRLFTPDALRMFDLQSGPMFDALVQWHLQHPDRNPHLPTNEVDLRAALKERQKMLADTIRQGGVKKAGSLAYTRTWRELPVSLMVNGQWQDVIVRDPLQHYRIALEQQVRQLALWRTVMDELLPRYGNFNEETGEMAFPLGRHELGMTDVPGLIDRLRSDVVRTVRNPKQASRLKASFNRLLDNYHRTDGHGWMDDFFVEWDSSVLGKAVNIADTAATTSILTLAPLYDFARWMTAVPGTGAAGMKGLLSALKDIVIHPRKFDAEYRALGALQSVYTDWTVNADSWFMDVARKGVRNVGMAFGRFTERRSQFIIARMHDAWVRAINGAGKGVTTTDAEYMRKFLRLTDNDIGEIARGEMSPSVRSKALQNAINTLAGLPEFAWNKGAVQNNRWGRFFFRFISVLNANVRATLALKDSITQNIRTAADQKQSPAARQAAAATAMRFGAKLLAFVAALAGNGFIQKYLRRAALGRPLTDAEDPETWSASLWEAMLEGGVFGPFYRVFEAAKYSNWNLAEVGARMSWPLSVMTDVGMALIGKGQYEQAPWTDRLKRLGLRYSPLGKSIYSWIGRLEAPTREDYYRSRSMVRAWLKDRGEEPSYGQVGRRNPFYYKLFEAIRDDNPQAIKQSLADVKRWAKTVKRWESERARRNLQSSLDARRPINLRPERRKAFLDTLSAKDRALVESVDSLYMTHRNRITRRPGMPIKPKAAQRPKKPTPGGDWYVE